MSRFTSADMVRHPLVARIVAAYEQRRHAKPRRGRTRSRSVVDAWTIGVEVDREACGDADDAIRPSTPLAQAACDARPRTPAASRAVIVLSDRR